MLFRSIVGDNNLNVNLQLVREGAAGALPYGKRSEQIASSTQFRQAELDAVGAQRGMWSTEEWRVAREAQANSKKRITNVSFTDVGRLYNNFKTSSVLLRMRNPDSDLSSMTSSGDNNDSTIIEGLSHGWAQSTRSSNTDGDFGSGYQLLKRAIPTAPRSLGHKKKLLAYHYAANTDLRQTMNHDFAIGHGKG